MNVEKVLKEEGVSTKAYPSLCLNNILNYADTKATPFAEKSQFYNKIMADGHIFNPYVHRRWLPYQFMRSMKYMLRVSRVDKSELELEKFMDMTYNYFYTFLGAKIWSKLIYNESKALYTLHTKDRQAYLERKNAFGEGQGLQDIKVFVEVWMKGEQIDEKEEMTEEFFEQVKMTTEECKHKQAYAGGYSEVGKRLERLLAEDFIKSGIYFTFKHLVMFEHEKLNLGEDRETVLEDSREHLKDKKFDWFYALKVILTYVENQM